MAVALRSIRSRVPHTGRPCPTGDAGGPLSECRHIESRAIRRSMAGDDSRDSDGCESLLLLLPRQSSHQASTLVELPTERSGISIDLRSGCCSGSVERAARKGMGVGQLLRDKPASSLRSRCREAQSLAIASSPTSRDQTTNPWQS
jgi:hypothetical protein